MHCAINPNCTPKTDGKLALRFRENDEYALAGVEELLTQLHTHPCHGCPERETHQTWANRWYKLRGQTDKNIAKIQGRTNTIARTFDRIINLLTDFGYVQHDKIGRASCRERVYISGTAVLIQKQRKNKS